MSKLAGTSIELLSAPRVDDGLVQTQVIDGATTTQAFVGTAIGAVVLGGDRYLVAEVAGITGIIRLP